MKRALASALLLLAVAAAPAAAQDVASLDRSSPVAAFGGRLLWSAFDHATQRWALMTRVGEVTSAVPVAERAVPFDADLGPGPDGAPVAVYSRCAREIGPSGSFTPALYGKGKGCDLFLFDFAAGTETRLAAASAPHASEFWPTVWRDRIAFARTYDARPDRSFLYARPLSAGGASTRLPAGPLSGCRQCNTRHAFPIALELYGRRLAFAWTYAGTHEGLETDIRLDTIGGPHVRVAHQNGGGLTQVQPGWPAFEAGSLYWSVGCFGDPGGCPRTFGLRRYRISTGAMASAPGPQSVLAHDRDRGTTWVLEDAQPGADCMGDPPVAGGTCTLRGLQPAFSAG
ncbi:MAG: hypothetical protein QOI62_436 [Solirubrobacteraceae bacterium]|jgi:hypothetical protein|nr:hypothetical protein [Solirubrobacteraceae bacterium]